MPVHCGVLGFSKNLHFMFCLLIIVPENLVIHLLSHYIYKNGHHCDRIILQNYFKLQHLKLLPHFTTLVHGTGHGEDTTQSSFIPPCLCSRCSLCLKCPSFPSWLYSAHSPQLIDHLLQQSSVLRSHSTF